MQTRLLKNAIENFHPFEEIQKLRSHTASSAEAASDLLLAAQYGRIDVMCWMMNAGISAVLPDALIQTTQPLAAKILLSCGANHLGYNQTLDPLVTSALFFRAIRRQEKGLISALDQNVQNKEMFSSLIKDKKRDLEILIDKTTGDSKKEAKEPAPLNVIDQDKADQIIECFKTRDYLALDTLCTGNSEKLITLLQYVISKEEEAARFLLIGTGLDLWEIARKWLEQPTLIDKLIKLATNEHGFYSILMRQSTRENVPPSSHIKRLLARKTIQPQGNAFCLPLFEKEMNHRYPRLGFKWETFSTLKKKEQGLIARLSHRIGLSHPAITTAIAAKHHIYIDSFMPSEILEIVLAYLSNEQQEKIAHLSDFLKEHVYFAQYGRNNEWALQIHQLKNELALLKNFLTAVQNQPDLTARFWQPQTCFGKFRLRTTQFTIAAGLLTLLGGLIAFFSYKSSLSRIDTLYHPRDPMIDREFVNTTCDILLPTVGISCMSVWEKGIGIPCKDPCENMDSAFYVILGGIGLLTVFQFLLQSIFCSPRIPQDDYDCISRPKLNLPVSRLNNNTRNSTTALFDYFNQRSDNPFEGMTLDTLLRDVKPIAETEEKNSEARLATLIKEKDAAWRQNENAPADDAESDHKEEPLSLNGDPLREPFLEKKRSCSNSQ